MRVLFIGHCNERYINYLNDILKTKHHALTGVIDLYQFIESEEKANKFDYLEVSTNYKPPKKSFIELLQIVFAGILKSKIQVVLKNFLSFRIKKYAVQFISDYFKKHKEEYYRNLISNFNPTIIHFHYINTVTLKWLQYVPENCKLILSFWGSDLMDAAGGVKEYNMQFKAVTRANIITTQTLDTRTILLSKFGQTHLPKVKCVTFNPLEPKREIIAEINNDLKRKIFFNKFNIHGKKTILVGYSAAIGQNHYKILDSINQLNNSIKEQLVCFIPLTYNGASNYVEKLLQKIDSLQLKVIPITEYMTDDEMMQLVVFSDIFISARNNDALNATMVESLYAENIVIAGAWLPYNVYHRLGCYYETISDFNEIGKKVDFIINNFENLKIKTKQNKNLVDDLYNNNQVANNWANIY